VAKGCPFRPPDRQMKETSPTKTHVRGSLYRPIDPERWEFFKTMHALGTYAINLFSGGCGMSIVARHKLDQEFSRRLPYPAVLPNIGKHGEFSVDGYLGQTELEKEGAYRTEWDVKTLGVANNSYSNVEYSSHYSRKLFVAEPIRNRLERIDPRVISDLVPRMKVVAALETIDPLRLAKRSKKRLLDTVASGDIPYVYLGTTSVSGDMSCGSLAKRVRATRLSHLVSRVKVSRLQFGVAPSIDLEPSGSDESKCRRIMGSIIENKEDPETKYRIFLPELLAKWRCGHNIRDKALFVGRFVPPSQATIDGGLLVKFSTALYVQSRILECMVRIYPTALDRSKLSPEGLFGSRFMLLGTTDGTEDRLRRPVLVANSLLRLPSTEETLSISEVMMKNECVASYPCGEQTESCKRTKAEQRYPAFSSREPWFERKNLHISRTLL
jgi:hypothetical protein